MRRIGDCALRDRKRDFLATFGNNYGFGSAKTAAFIARRRLFVNILVIIRRGISFLPEAYCGDGQCISAVQTLDLL